MSAYKKRGNEKIFERLLIFLLDLLYRKIANKITNNFPQRLHLVAHLQVLQYAFKW